MPDGYDGKRRFPALYLLDGSDGQYGFWLNSPRDYDPRAVVPLLVRDFPAIVVMPDGGAQGEYVNWWNGGRMKSGPDGEYCDAARDGDRHEYGR